MLIRDTLKFNLKQLLHVRTVGLAFIYGFFFVLSLFMGYQLRFDFVVPEEHQKQFLNALPYVLVLKLSIMAISGQFGVLLSYFRLPDLYRVFLAISLASAVLIFLWLFFPSLSVPPRSVILADFIFSFFLVISFRTTLRVLRERLLGEKSAKKRIKRVVVVGAGQTGTGLVSEVLGRRNPNFQPVLFLDDDKRKHNRMVHGIPVVGDLDELELIKKRYNLDGVVIAITNGSQKRISEITKRAYALGLSVDIVPAVTDLATGKVTTSRMRPVEIQDLLGREQVQLDSDLIRNMLEKKRVFVTGAGGSIGSELCHQISTFHPSQILLIEQCEVQLFKAEQELIEEGFSGIILPVIADILDEERMRQLFSKYKPDLVFHAAAHKHVPLMERQPAEAVKNNSLGTALIGRLSGEFKVKEFVLVSTDKAINPTNAMGASKRLAELALQCLSLEFPETIYCAVRFGNVLGSSGSVIPTFRKQIESGGPVTVTHRDVTRYFMTIPEAVGLVLQCTLLAQQDCGSETSDLGLETRDVGRELEEKPKSEARSLKSNPIFVLDMGEPVKIVDLARQMITLSGFEPDEDIEIKITGLRPGEKLYEELQHIDEEHLETSHPKILRFVGSNYDHENIKNFYDTLPEKLKTLSPNELKSHIQTFIPEYKPFVD